MLGSLNARKRLGCSGAPSEAFSVEYDVKKQAGPRAQSEGKQSLSHSLAGCDRIWKEFLKANFPECPLLFKDCV